MQNNETMSKNFIQKNIKLSLDFGRYISHHPSAYKKLPKGAHVFFTVKGDKSFNANSRELMEKTPAKKVIEARKEGMKWTLQPLAS